VTGRWDLWALNARVAPRIMTTSPLVVLVPSQISIRPAHIQLAGWASGVFPNRTDRGAALHTRENAVCPAPPTATLNLHEKASGEHVRGFKKDAPPDCPAHMSRLL
jgi:hypothetical protein